MSQHHIDIHRVATLARLKLTDDEAARYGSQLEHILDYVGVIAFELFDLGSKLVINEIAPRVHNTGHFSQAALNVDQFELHLRCILGMPLPTIELKQPAFVMVNLLGLSNRQPAIKKFPTGTVHWYDKQENRPRRKMGHVNYIGKNKKVLLHKALLERKGILL